MFNNLVTRLGRYRTCLCKEKTPLVMPWYNSDYQRLFSDANLRISNERAFVLLEGLNFCVNLTGDFAELGVYKGSTAYIIGDFIKKRAINCRLHLFDTFYGVPDPSDYDMQQRKGSYRDVTMEEVACFLEPYASKIAFYPGVIPETFNLLECSVTFRFIHIHLNLYQSTKDSLEYLYGRLNQGGLILVEDYGLSTCMGVKKAVDEFFNNKKTKVIHLPTGQGLVFKNE